VEKAIKLPKIAKRVGENIKSNYYCGLNYCTSYET
jgi:hypothetical protein